MKEFFVVKGFRNTQVINLPDVAALHHWGNTPDTRDLIRRYRTEAYHDAKGMMPCLIVGEKKPHHLLERKDDNFAHTSHLLLDYDHPCCPDAEATRIAHILDQRGLLRHTYIERSISGKLHLLAPRLTTDVAADIQTYAHMLGLDFDTKVTNPSRLMVITFEALAGTTLDNLMHEDDINEDKNQPEPNSESIIQDSEFTNSYHGLPYDLIVDNLIDLMGGHPQVGERNQYLYKIAAELRTITDNTPQWIATLLAQHHYFGLPHDEALATITSATKKKEQPRMSNLLSTAIRQASEASVHQSSDEVKNENEDNTPTLITHDSQPFDPFADTPPAMPDVKRLPRFVQQLIKNTPRQCQPHVLNCCEPALATYLVETTTTAIDGSTLHLGSGWLAVGIAKMSTGKSSRNEPLRIILQRLKEQDDLAREEMEAWNEKARCTKASDLPPRPVMKSQLLGSDCTASAMLMRLKAQPQGAQIITVDEMAQLTGLQTNTTTESKTPLLLAFNQECLTVDRSSEAGVSGSVTVRLNVSAQGTPYQAARFFQGGWHTGLISRFSFNTIIEPDLMDDDDFVYGSYKDYDTLMAPYIDCLQAQQGKELSIKRADDHARRMRRETLQLAAEYTSEPLRVLCRRQSIIAQKRAYLYTLLEGGKWSQRLEDFLTWRYQYGLWAIFHTLGSLIAAEQAAEEGALTKKVKQDGPTNWLMALPETFTLQQLTDLRKLKGAATDKKALTKQLSNWRSRSLIADHPEQPGTYINHKKRPAA